MVIGNGLVAKKFHTYEHDECFIIFASGVSNSKNENEADYKRELTLLKKTLSSHSNKTVVYFSTCSIYDPEQNMSRYSLHKKEMEDLIISSGIDHLIFRTSNLVGKTENKNTILNFFIHQIVHQRHFNLWVNAIRNLIDVDDLFKIVNEILKNETRPKKIINIANPVSHKVIDIIAAIEHLLKQQAHYTAISKGTDFEIDISDIIPIVEKLDLNFTDNYLMRLLIKYYHNQ